MARFQPTAEQRKFIEQAERQFEARLTQPTPHDTPFSRYFLEKCSSESGVQRPREPQGQRRKRKLFDALVGMFGGDNWLTRLLRRY